MRQVERITLIGSGNMSHALGKAFHDSGCKIVEVYGRNADKASTLAKSLNATFQPNLNALANNSSLYIIAVSDDAIESVVAEMPVVDGLVVHTSGTVSSRVLLSKFNRCGVFYPLQTFSLDRSPDFNKIPIIIRACDLKDEVFLKDIASGIGSKVYPLRDDERRNLHVAAVIVNNFTNHLMTLAANFLEVQKLPSHLLNALINETVAKAIEKGAKNAQTGPAIRGDKGTIESHLSILEEADDPFIKNIYKIFSESISSYYGSGK